MPPTNNENQSDEKLLTGTEAEKLLPSGSSEDYPRQNAKEFLKYTPLHELKNIFGATSNEETPKQDFPKAVPPPSENKITDTSNFLPPIPKKAPTPEGVGVPTGNVWKTLRPEAPKFVKIEKPQHLIIKLVNQLPLIVLIIIVILYIWGGILTMR